MWAMMVTYVITYDDPNDDNDDLTADAGDDVDLCFFWGGGSCMTCIHSVTGKTEGDNDTRNPLRNTS